MSPFVIIVDLDLDLVHLFSRYLESSPFIFIEDCLTLTLYYIYCTFSSVVFAMVAEYLDLDPLYYISRNISTDHNNITIGEDLDLE